MEYFKHFYENLGDINTAFLVAFLTGFVIGLTRFGQMNIFVGIIIGIIFAVITSLLLWLIYRFLPDNVNVSLNLRPLVTIFLLFIFFIVITSAPTISNILSKIGTSK